MSNGIIQHSSNQCLDFFQSRRLEYDSLKYRSEAEMAIAKAIDKHNRSERSPSEQIYYIPNGVIVTPEARTETSSVKIESDFLIFYKGVTAVLEVDGSQHSEPSVIKKDTEKERHWKDQDQGMNVFVVERFSAKECLESPDKVLVRFLNRIKVNLFFLTHYEHDIEFYNFNHVDGKVLIESMLTEYYCVCQEYFKRWRRYESLTPLNFLDYAKNVSCPVSFNGYKFTFLQNTEYDLLNTEKMKDCSIECGLKYEFESVTIRPELYYGMTSDVLKNLRFIYSGNGDKDDLDNYHFIGFHWMDQ